LPEAVYNEHRADKGTVSNSVIFHRAFSRWTVCCRRPGDRQ